MSNQAGGHSPVPPEAQYQPNPPQQAYAPGWPSSGGAPTSSDPSGQWAQGQWPQGQWAPGQGAPSQQWVPQPGASPTGPTGPGQKKSAVPTWAWIGGVALVVLVVGVIFSLGAGYEPPSSQSSGQSSEIEMPTDPPPLPARPDGELGTRGNPVPLGEPVDVGRGWTMTVDAVNLDADDIVQETSEYNDPPPDGWTYVLITATLEYDGPDDPATVDIHLSAVGQATNVAHDEYTMTNFIQTPEPELNAHSDTYKGGIIEGNAVIQVPDEDLDTLLIVATPVELKNRFRTFFATE